MYLLLFHELRSSRVICFVFLEYEFQGLRALEASLGGTGDQEVACSTPAGSATFFHGDLIMKYFLHSSLP